MKFPGGFFFCFGKGRSMEYDFSYWCKASYFDTSALVKLVSDDLNEEQGREAVRKYYWSRIASVYTTPFCVAETFGVFKRKRLREQITKEQYLRDCHTFTSKFLACNLRQDQASVLSPAVFAETERLVMEHNIDFVDCLQIVTIMHGQFSKLGPNSKSLLITADAGLAKAARAENARVWECRTEPAPDGVAVAVAGA
jgi:predicted nucleic acid-binding protein